MGVGWGGGYVCFLPTLNPCRASDSNAYLAPHRRAVELALMEKSGATAVESRLLSAAFTSASEPVLDLSLQLAWALEVGWSACIVHTRCIASCALEVG